MTATRQPPAGHRISPLPDESGIALLATLGIVLALLPLAAAVAVAARLDVLVQRNVFSATEAFYVAEAGLAHALAELRPAASMHALLDGPDAAGSTADDGVFPFKLAAPAQFAPPPGGYEVIVEPGPGNSVRLLSRGRGLHAAVREVEALVAPAGEPFAPAALYIDSHDVDIELGSRGFLISGTPQLGQQSKAIAGIAVPSASVAAALRASVEPPAAVSGAAGNPSIAVSSELEISRYPDALAARADAVFQSSAANAAELGTMAAPQLTVVGNDWTVAADVSGFGILLVRGDLAVTGRLRFRGLIVVEGAIDVSDSGTVEVEGALWVAGSGANRLRFSGAGFVRYEPAILSNVDAAIPQALLHLPEVFAWREVS